MAATTVPIQGMCKAFGLFRQFAVACLPFVLGCSAQAVPGRSEALPAAVPLVIQGLESLGVAGSLKAQVTDFKVTPQGLRINAAGLPGSVTVTPFRAPWAAQAHATFNDKSALGAAGHSAQFFRTLQPFGMVQGIFITRSNTSLPWLGIQTNATSGQKVLDDWSVLYSKGRWSLQQLGRPADSNPVDAGAGNLQIGRTTTLVAKGNTWCLHTVEKAQRQGETPLLDWVLLQQMGSAAKCV